MSNAHDDRLQDTEAYERIAAIIRYVRERAVAGRTSGNGQPALDEIAAWAGLSDFHLQRLFSEWVGISPKRYLQYLTKEYAKQALRASSSVLDASLEAGLSSPGRLHDLLVTCEAVTPGEYGSLGEGLAIRYGIRPTPFGDALIAVTQRGVCRVEFVDRQTRTQALLALREEWPAATIAEDGLAVQSVTDSMFAGNVVSKAASKVTSTAAPRRLHLMVKGSNHQIKVWEALLRIPSGSVTTYRRLAQTLGNEKAARAVGNAVGANPLAWLIPCHRVIRETGELGGYRWGIERKQAMLAWEAARQADGQDTGLPARHEKRSMA